MKKITLIIFIIIIILAAAGFAFREKLMAQFFKPNTSTTQNGKASTSTKPEIVIENLDTPWELAFLPEGDMLVTERDGKVLRINAGSKDSIIISGVANRGEGGLLGLALDPNFSENKYIYLYLTTQNSSIITNQVERYTLDGSSVSDRTIIIKDIPGSTNHDGGRIAFGPDGKLYITTGDVGVEKNAQDTNSLAGKILRINSDGTIPSDNPFNNATYSYGHRNAQGIIWDENGELWATEHGRSGAQTGYDELNKIVAGNNYGWPTIQGNETKEGMVAPQIHSGGSETWAPAGIAYLNNHVMFAGLRGESIYAADISNGTAKDLKKYLSSVYGRLRTVIVGPDGMLYILTNNRDGRGTAKSGDDKIIKVSPETFGI